MSGQSPRQPWPGSRISGRWPCQNGDATRQNDLVASKRLWESGATRNKRSRRRNMAKRLHRRVDGREMRACPVGMSPSLVVIPEGLEGLMQRSCQILFFRTKAEKDVLSVGSSHQQCRDLIFARFAFLQPSSGSSHRLLLRHRLGICRKSKTNALQKNKALRSNRSRRRTPSAQDRTSRNGFPKCAGLQLSLPKLKLINGSCSAVVPSLV
ncbi:uncharacterized protein B0T15DRAFT_137502 [Chaetomium strumarium]|uniref:Uncharacterized protein n=1 Tax=Chaetomium strumarium TaxID=1170767 RepID=A0AAJ0GUB0_9PEZI|nr:hypothetical protein B0T15DRAFT_137502 [Chaetomium strumarium]